MSRHALRQAPVPLHGGYLTHLDIDDRHVYYTDATAGAADESLTLHRFRIHILGHPFLLQFCKSSLQRGENVEDI